MTLAKYGVSDPRGRPITFETPGSLDEFGT
jgi:hypothetical protein